MTGWRLSRICTWSLRRDYSLVPANDPQPYKKLTEEEELMRQNDNTGMGKRGELVFMLFMGFAGVYAMRVNLSVAILAMVKQKPARSIQPHSSTDTCPVPASVQHASITSEDEGEFDWDEQMQGIVLGSFFYGYLLTNYIGGRWAERLGGRLVFGTGVFLTGVLTILSPFAARHSITAFIFIRVLEGMTEGVTFPAMNVMMSHWIPPNERARAIARSCGGCQVGTVITLAISGWLCQTKLGWPSVFYLFGFYGVVWAYFWFLWCHDTPDHHPTITPAEKNYIRQAIGEHRGKKELEVPWWSIMTSIPFLVVILTHMGENWGFYCLLTELPTYLKNVQHFDMKQNGVLSALPYLINWIVTLVYSSFVEKLMVRGVLTLPQTRILSMLIASVVPMISILLISWAGCNRQLAMVIICVAVGSTGAKYCGLSCAFQELSPNYSGILTGISNTFGTIPGFLAPALTGAIINNQQTLTRWTLVFQIIAFDYLIISILYPAFMSFEVQPWNVGPKEKSKQTQNLIEPKTV